MTIFPAVCLAVLSLNAPDPIFSVTRRTLSNGLEVWVKERRETRAVEVRAVVKVGFRYESAEDSGLSHLLEHMLFKGTARQTEAELKWAIEGKGGTRNGYTTPDSTYYFANIRDSHFDFALQWLEDVLFHSLLREADLREARRDVYSEQQGHFSRLLERIFLTGLFQPALVRAAEASFPHARVGERAIVNLDHVRERHLRRHFADHYHPNNMAVIVVGNVETEHAFEAIGKLFGALPAAPVQKKNYVEYRPPRRVAEVRTLWMPPAGEMTDIRHGIWTRGRLDPDRLALRVISEHMDRRLNEEVRYRRSLAYSVGSFMIEAADVGALVAYANVRRPRESEARQLIAKVVEEIRSRPLQPAELRDAKEAYLGWAARFYESNSRLADLYTSLFVALPAGAPLRDEFADIEAITAAEVTRVAQARLHPRARMTVVSRPPLTYLEVAFLVVFSILMISSLAVAILRRRRVGVAA